MKNEVNAKPIANNDRINFNSTVFATVMTAAHIRITELADTKVYDVLESTRQQPCSVWILKTSRFLRLVWGPKRLPNVSTIVRHGFCTEPPNRADAKVVLDSMDFAKVQTRFLIQPIPR